MKSIGDGVTGDALGGVVDVMVDSSYSFRLHTKLLRELTLKEALVIGILHDKLRYHTEVSNGEVWFRVNHRELYTELSFSRTTWYRQLKGLTSKEVLRQNNIDNNLYSINYRHSVFKGDTSKNTGYTLICGDTYWEGDIEILEEHLLNKCPKGISTEVFSHMVRLLLVEEYELYVALGGVKADSTSKIYNKVKQYIERRWHLSDDSDIHLISDEWVEYDELYVTLLKGMQVQSYLSRPNVRLVPIKSKGLLYSFRVLHSFANTFKDYNKVISAYIVYVRQTIKRVPIRYNEVLSNTLVHNFKNSYS